ncbi:MAG: GNAT family N-acetyltransferase [Actinomycetota bacterium]
MRIERARESSTELVEAFRRLVPQLSETAEVPDAAKIQNIVSSDSTFLLIARSEEKRIIGMLTLVTFVIPTGTRAWIEDVIVDDEQRGRGIGTALVEEALRLAAESSARTVDLTSRPDREVANRLYERMGFRKRATNVYRRDLD